MEYAGAYSRDNFSNISNLRLKSENVRKNRPFPGQTEFKSHLSGLKRFLMDKCLKSLP